MKRLYLHVYLVLVASLVLFVVIAGIVWRLMDADPPPRRATAILAALAAEALPPPEAPPEAQRAALVEAVRQMAGRVTLYGPDGTRIAAVGPPLPAPRRPESGWFHPEHGPPAWSLTLPDGRVLVVRSMGERPNPVVRLVFFLGLIALGIAAAAYPIARRVTGRLERLQASVEALGRGELSARVKVEGKDEVAALAASFNAAAARIEALVGAHRQMLANASHELRSPLARIRMAIEMMGRQTKPDLKKEIERDIAELDALVDEILLASRLEAVGTLDRREPVDLAGLAAEECTRADATLAAAEPVTVTGDAKLLRRLIRNLLDNARRHGGGADVEVFVRRRGKGAELAVCDRGPGVPEAERERIFEPFYRPAGTGEREGGVGLGLALVRQIAQHHGGTVRCTPRDGGGTCFVVEISR